MTNTDENTPPSLEDIAAAAFDAVEAGEVAPQAEPLPFDEPAAAPDAVVDAPAGDPAEGKQPAPDVGDAANTGEPGADTQAQPTDDRAPSSWKPEIAQKWAEVPKEVRDEIKRRETDYHKGIEQYKQAASIGHAIEKVVTPHMETFQRLGVDPLTAINHLLAADQRLRYGSPEQKAEYLGVLAQEYGIALETVKPRPPLDPAMMELQRQNQHLQQYRQSVEQRETQVVMTEIERFAADPKHTHFETVRDDMVALLNSGRAATLDDAYDKAVWMRPDIRKSLVEQQRATAEKTATAQARSQRAKAAAVGVKGSAPSQGGVLKPGTDIRSIVAAAVAGDIQ